MKEVNHDDVDNDCDDEYSNFKDDDDNDNVIFTFRKNISWRLGMASPLKSLLMMISPRGDRMKN